MYYVNSLHDVDLLDPDVTDVSAPQVVVEAVEGAPPGVAKTNGAHFGRRVGIHIYFFLFFLLSVRVIYVTLYIIYVYA